MENSEIKKIIRRETLQKRDSLSKKLRRERDIIILQRIIMLQEYSDAKTVLFFASFRSEVDTTDLIKLSMQIGKKTVLPKVVIEENILKLYEIKSIHELVRGYMWIPEPAVDETRLRKLSDVDLVIIPGAAFDTSGSRIGYGGGYYDRLLSDTGKKIPVVAPAYEEQIVENIPSEPHDIKVNLIVTDTRIIRPIFPS